jgi:hypothetical protein
LLPPIHVTTHRVRLTLHVADAGEPVGQTVANAKSAAAIARAVIGSDTTECVLVLFLDAHTRVTGTASSRAHTQCGEAVAARRARRRGYWCAEQRA